jgi:hypothetical protein
MLLALVCAVPWLAPCTFGLGTMASGLVNKVSRPLVAEPLDYLPHPDLKQWAARPGPMLEVRTVGAMPASLFIRDDELPGDKSKKASRPGTDMRGRAGSFVGMISTLLAITDASTRGFLEDGDGDMGILDDMPGRAEDDRRQLALSEFPFVLLQGEELRYLDDGKEHWPKLARADKRSKVTVITKDGTFIGIARRIHFRSSSTEVILEGDPTVQSGQQHLKGARTDAVMRLDFKKRLVTVNGPVVEKKLFR